jgi:lipid-binding SYLF domain-containing protein
MKFTRRLSLVALATALAGTWGSALAADIQEAKTLVEKARTTFAEVLRARDFDSMRAGMKQAKGVLTYPQVLKAGFFLGGGSNNNAYHGKEVTPIDIVSKRNVDSPHAVALRKAVAAAAK